MSSVTKIKIQGSGVGSRIVSHSRVIYKQLTSMVTVYPVQTVQLLNLHSFSGLTFPGCRTLLLRYYVRGITIVLTSKMS